MLGPWSGGACGTTRDRETAAAPFPPPVVVSGEESQVVPRGVMGSKVGGNKQDASCRRQQRGEVRGRCKGNHLLRLVVVACDDAGIQQRLVLKVHTRSNEELGKVLCAEIAFADGSGEASPERGTGEPEGRQCSGSRFGKGIVNGAAEARPEVRSLSWRAVGQGLGRCGGENSDEIGFLVIWKMDVCYEGIQQGIGRWNCDNEDGCHGRDL